MVDKSTTSVSHGLGPPSSWVKRWSHLVPPGGTVLDMACGQGRHMKWFADQGHAVLGVDRSAEAIHAAAAFGETVLADIENGPWPLMNGEQPRQFDAVIVTNYLWRPLFPVIVQSVASGGLLIYETFSEGNETVGKPSRPDFLLRSAELLQAFNPMRVIAFEEGFLENPPRFVQRLTAAQPDSRDVTGTSPMRYTL
ncbi:MAG: class I SAM-dependent methyltransferase [Rhodoferax sp.]